MLAAAVLSLPGTADAGSPDQFIGFGDSTMDSGYFRFNPTGGSPSLPPGAPSNALDIAIARTVAAGGSGAFLGPGVVDTIQIAEKFGLSGAPFIIGGGGGTNYANGSAQTVSTTAGNGYFKGLYNNVPITTQIYDYLATVNNHANPNALYMVSYGGNDLMWLQNQAAPPPWQPFITGLANSLSTGMAALQAAGGRTIMVLNVYAYARVVGADGSLTPENALIVQQATAYSAQVWSNLASARVNFVPADIEGLLRYVSQHPAPFGFTPATVLTANPACGATSGLVCTPGDLVSPDAQQTHLWGDPAHLRYGRANDGGKLPLQPPDRAERDLDADGKRSAGWAGPNRLDPGSNRSVGAVSRTDGGQRLDHRRRQRIDVDQHTLFP